MIKKNIPNVLTLCNLCCGCIAIVFAFEGNLVWSAYMVGIACVFDFLDGLVARALNVNSEIGKQLDSLADMVSFGVVPGVMMYKMIFYTQHFSSFNEALNHPASFLDRAATLFQNYFSEREHINYTAMIGFIITVFSAVRLAKFNLDNRQSDSFLGLPTPANAIFISSLPVILHLDSSSELIKQFIFHPNFLISLTFISSIALIFPISLFALKFKDFSWAANKVRYIFLALALVLLIVFQFAAIPLIIILYIVMSIINNLVAKKSV